MVAKTVYDTYWKPSPITGLVFLVMAVAITYVPYYLKVPVFVTPWMAVAFEIVFGTVVTLFFYGGISRAKQFKIAMLTFCGVSVFGLLSNLFYQATFLVSVKLLTTDFVVLALINIGAMALTMSCYRISQKKIEVSDQEEANSIHPEKMKQLAPVIYALPIIASVVGVYFSPNVPNGDNFTISLPFYVCGQLFMSLWSAQFFFKDKTQVEKNRLGLTILSITMLLGTLGNMMHHLTVLKPGLRIMLNSNEFLIMNAGAIVIVLVFMTWNKTIVEQQNKQAKLLESLSPPPSSQSVATPPEKVATPVTAEASTPPPPESSIKIEQPQDTKTV